MSDTYRIRPLEWSLITESSTWVSHSAQTPFGIVHAEGYPNTAGWYFWNKKDGSKINPSLEAAKAAAEQWYREKLLTALERVT